MRAASRALLFFLAFGVAAYAAVVYGLLPLGSVVHPDMRTTFVAHPAGLYTHVFAAIVALALGPFQFSARLRRAHIRVHRWSGRVYLGVGVLVGGLSGLYMAQFAFGGVVARLGFALLAACWLFTGVRAFLAVRRGAIEEHRRWMVRNFALTFAAVTLRVYIPASVAAGFDFAVVYPFVAWLCWVPNILVAEWVFNRAHESRSPNRPRAASF
jgi:uncharacterized membrane protein